jgi:hypothetical protein
VIEEIKMNNELIKTKNDLIWYLTTKQVASKNPPEFAYVSTALRKNILTDEYQGKVIVSGTVKRFKFESIGGGVWKASIAKL